MVAKHRTGDREEQHVYRTIRRIEQRRGDRIGALDAEIRTQCSGEREDLLRCLAFVVPARQRGVRSVQPACTSGSWDEKVTMLHFVAGIPYEKIQTSKHILKELAPDGTNACS